MTDSCIDNPVGEILADNPGLPPAELNKAIDELRTDTEHHRWFFTEIRRRCPGVTLFWNVEQQAVCMRGIALRKDRS